MHRCAFYECKTCQKPFFGGLIDCEQEAQQTNTSDLNCATCLLKKVGYGQKICSEHGGDQNIIWKCMYCCSEATYICNMGTLHLCKSCKAKSEYKRVFAKCRG